MKAAIHDGPTNRLVEILENKSEKIHWYGVSNTLPNQWMNAVMDSGTARRCVAKWAEFIQADGFVDKDSAKKVMNSKQTADDLLAEIAGYAGLNIGFAVVVKRQMGLAGQLGSNAVAEVYCLPFETARVGLDEDKYQVNPTYGKHQSEFKTSEARFYPAFNANETPEQTHKIIEDQMRPKSKGGLGGYMGNVLYIFEKGPGQNVYPIPEAYAGLDDILSDASLSSFERENLENGFFPSAMLFTQGEIDDVTEGPDGLTNWKRFCKILKEFQGRGNRSKLLHLQFDTIESKPELQSFDIKAVLDGLGEITERIFRKVCRHFGVPSILIEPTDTALGNGSLLLNAVQMFNSSVNKKQRMIQRAFTLLFPENDWSISTLNIITYLPAEVTQLLSKDQLLKMYGIAEEQTEVVPGAEVPTKTAPKTEVSPETLKAQAALRGSVGGVTALLAVQQAVAAQTADYNAAISTLKIMFGFTQEEAVELLGTPKIETEPVSTPQFKQAA